MNLPITHNDSSQTLRQAIVEMRQLRSQIADLEQQLNQKPKTAEPIAIIGMACRFPDAPDLQTYWKNLRDGHCAVQEVPADRWNLAQFYDPDAEAAGKMYTRHGCFIDRPGEFDAGFFNISPREAIAIDPQQRLLLETSYRAIEHAGIPIESLQGSKTGVYIGLCFDDYARLSVASGDRTKIDAFGSLGNTKSIAAGRIAYTFGLQGTTMQLDTTCSSSLLAVHLAAQAIRQGELDMALVGGVNLMLAPDVTIGFCKLKALAPDGRSKAFDASADGYGRGEGCGMVMLKRLSDARRDDDRVLAVIQGSATNHDGSSNGLTAPNGNAQVDVIKAAIENAKITNSQIKPELIRYLEAHGTGTVLGDPIEVMALQQAYGVERSQPLLIGSVKANIGHLESAAGIAGLIKLVLAMQHRTLPPQPNYHQPNPHIPWADVAIQVSQKAQTWDGEMLAGISSFGMSGTNVHMILAGGSAAVEVKPINYSSHHLLCISAKSQPALRALIEQYIEHFQASPELDQPVALATFCQACLTQRSHFSHRLGLVISDRTDAIAQLQQALDRPPTNSNPITPISQANLISQTDLTQFQNHTATPEVLQRLREAYNCFSQIDDQPIDWSALLPMPQPRIALPSYPFQTQHYWVDPVSLQLPPQDATSNHPLLGDRLKLAQTQTHYFTQSLSLETLPYLADHEVAGRAILPTSALIELFWAGISQIIPAANQLDNFTLQNFAIHQPLIISRSLLQLQTTFTPTENTETYHCKIFHYDEAGNRWVCHASAQAQKAPCDSSPIVLADYKKQCPNLLDITGYYQQCRQVGLNYGSQFHSLTQLAQGDQAAIAAIALPESLSNSHYYLHPILLDGCLQAIGAVLPLNLKQQQLGFVPIGCDQITCYQTSQESSIYAIVQLIESNVANHLKVDIQVVDRHGNRLITLQGLNLQALPKIPQQSELTPQLPNWLYTVNWQPTEIKSIANVGKNVVILDRATITPADLIQAQIVTDTAAVIYADAVNSTEIFDTIAPTRILYYATATDVSIANLLRWTQTILQRQLASQSIEFIIITQGAINAGAATSGCNTSAAGLWGFAKTLRLEQPHWQVRGIDLDPQLPESAQLDWLNHGINQSPDQIIDLAIRHQPQTKQATYYCPKLQSYKSSSTASPTQLVIQQRGNLDTLTIVPQTPRSPNSNEVEIRVLATGINFRDVLNALNLYPGEAGELGCECVGEVISIGENVQHLNIGDRVIALATGSFSQSVTINANLVVQFPEQLAPTQAATIGVAFLTAYYTLSHLANIKAGDRVLIHAAAGAVGQAAVQIAHAIGAEVYATANPKKWQLLRSLGVQHIFNSRDPKFAEALLDANPGLTFDVVLNSLSDEFIPASLNLLKPAGKFLEIGKVGIWSAAAMQQARSDVQYHPIDLVELCQTQPELIQQLLQSVIQQFATGKLKPIAATVFPLNQAKSAFRLMQQGLHQGKLVIAIPPQAIQIKFDRSYLITGGTGGLGLAMAQLLADEGATQIILIARRQPSPSAQTQIQALENRGVTVTIANIDSRDRQAIAQVLTNLHHPLAGIIHAAGILEDNLIAQQSPEQFANVIDTKVQTAWHLHELTQHQPLDFFYLCSSATAIFGSPGQSNHVIANTELDAFAQYRHQLGLPALSINWGIWAEIGSAIAPAVTQQMQQRGIRPMPQAECLEIFKSLLQNPPFQSQIAVMDIDWQKIQQQRNWHGFLDEINLDQPSAPSHNSEILQLLNHSDRASAIEHLETYLKTRLSKILGFQVADLNVNTGFFDLGMDSLTAVELSSRLRDDLDYALPATAAFDYPTIHKLATYLTDQIRVRSPILSEPETTNATTLEALSTDEIAQLLAQELSSIQQEQVS